MGDPQMNGSSWKRTACLVVFAFLFVGCSPVKRVTFDRQANKSIRSVALLSITSPPKLSYDDPDPVTIGVSAGFGAIGGLVGGTVMAIKFDARSKELAEAIKDQDFEISRVVTEAMERAMTAKGYTVKRQSVTRQKHDKLLDTYDDLPKTTDVYLDVVVRRAGYFMDRELSDHRHEPWIDVAVRLIDANTEDVLYAEWVQYGGRKVSEQVHITSTPDVRRKEWKEILDDPAWAVKGLRVAAKAVAERIVADFSTDSQIAGVW